MNLHPIFVHFPIALLTTYSILELIRFKVIARQPYFFYLKAVLVILGGLGALASAATGDTAKAAVRSGAFHSPLANFQQVVSVHEQFADLTVMIFGILALCYLILWINQTGYAAVLHKSSFGKIWQVCINICNTIIGTRLVIPLALAGLIVITVTGGLGGMLVYGQNADPFFRIVYNLLF